MDCNIAYDFNLGNVNDLSGNNNHGKIHNLQKKREVIKIPNSIIPHRVSGRLKCLPHKDEGLVKDENGNDKWVKGKNNRKKREKIRVTNATRNLGLQIGWYKTIRI